MIRPHTYTVNGNYDPLSFCSLNREEKGRDFPTMHKCQGLSNGRRSLIRESLVSITPQWQANFFIINYLEHFGR